ncbi:centriolar coiled-coil protein of 110 kDa-like isoform X2 [Syngnathoides biaculeatus]|uniref:centriolar coiled-coil protein of 110 kDa-like isoform X2 n=1 Tax=Syngnathoides biaculeatus TaxID=300417 RepID=UPI002ADDBF02|nr:centriolar coiled-coil protein of 110 kDa-like isoform X2 [Syngnathoides biaculeatus]
MCVTRRPMFGSSMLERGPRVVARRRCCSPEEGRRRRRWANRERRDKIHVFHDCRGCGVFTQTHAAGVWSPKSKGGETSRFVRCAERVWMESYEEFSSRSAATLREEGEFGGRTREAVAAKSSVILFCGKAVLSPLMSEEQREQMRDLRRRATQLETGRRNRQRNKPSAPVRDIPASCSAQSQGRTGSATKDGNILTCKCEHLGQITGCRKRSSLEILIPKQTRQEPCGDADNSPSPRATTLSGYKLITDTPRLPEDPAFGVQTSKRSTSPVLNGLSTGDEFKLETEEKSDEDDLSMYSLLKQTKEDVSKEQSQDRLKVSIPTPSPEAVSEAEICSPKRGVEFGFSLHHSPIGPPKSPVHQNLYHPGPQQPVSPCLLDQYIRQPSPESPFSPRIQRRKPRPFSTGNLHMVFPGTPWEGACRSDWDEALSWSPDHWSLVSSNGVGAQNRRENHQSGRCGVSPVREPHSPVSPSLPSPIAQHDHLSSNFRRRCHTLDSQLHTDQAGTHRIDRSQERTPRFMAGVTMRPSAWRNSASLMSKSSYVENPSPNLRRPHICPQVKLRTEPDDPRGPRDETSPIGLRNAADPHANNAEEIKRRAQVLEDMQRRLEEEHALQMSLLLAEQENEQQRLRLELEETERSLREQECEKVQYSDTSQWKRVPGNDGLPTASSSASTPGHGLSSPISSNVTSPSAQSPVYLRGPTWAAHKPQARLSQVLKAEQQRALFRIGAIARGFLTRRLLKTHKVQHLRQTISDTQEFISSFQTEGPQKRSTFSAQDLSLQDRVQAHLRAALYDIHEIFFEIPLGDRLALLQQDRELCAEKRQRDLEKAKKEKERAVLSAATQRSLDRKKREGESPGQARKVMHKPKSPTPIRVQKSSQVQKGVPSQLNRQGSWYKKTPDARVKRTDNLKNLKKQHSLG